MGQFKYKGKDAAGRVRQGVIAAHNRKAAKTRIANMRLRSVTLSEVKNAQASGLADGEKEYLNGLIIIDKKGRILISMGEKITTKDIIVFSKQLSTMINSGVPLVQSMDLLAKQQNTRLFRKILTTIRLEVENGAKLSEGFAMFPKYFDKLYVSMIKAGEASGNLDIILMKLVEYIEKAEKIKKQVKGAMVYPTLVIIVAIGVVSALLLFVVPTFAEQFSSSGKELPGLTQWLVDLSEGFKANWYNLLGGIIALIIGLKFYAKTEQGRLVLDQLMLRLPLTGNLLRKVAVGRFCSTMATMLSSGVNLLESLTICASSAGSKPIEDFVINVRKKVEEGERLSVPLADGDIFPEMVTSMISVGENTGALDEMLTKVSDFYEEEVELAVAALLSMIEPILIVVLGGIIGFVVIALYLPIFDLASTIG